MKNKSWQFLEGTRNTYIIRGCRNANRAFQESRGILRVQVSVTLPVDARPWLPRTSPSGTNSAPEQICITFDRRKECTSGTRGRACSSWPTLAARFCTNTKKRRVVSGARRTGRGGTEVRSEGERNEGI